MTLIRQFRCISNAWRKGARMTGSFKGISMFEPDPREANAFTQYTGLKIGAKRMWDWRLLLS